MGKNCIVPSCKNTNTNSKERNVTFHILPKDPQKRLVWLEALELQIYAQSFEKLKELPRVCSEHFSDSSFKIKTALKDDAVPQSHINRDGSVHRRIQIPGKEHPSTPTAGESKKGDDNADSGQETTQNLQDVDYISSKESQNGTMRLSAGSLFPETPAFSLTQELMMDLHELSDKIQNFYPDALGKQFTLTFQGEDGDKSDYIFTSASEKRRSGERHSSLHCNECGFDIVGFRYKCVSCVDYDLCSACETLGLHTEHLMMRIAKPIKLKRARALLQQWCEAMQAAGITTAEEITRSQAVETQPKAQQPPSRSSESFVKQIAPSITFSNKVARGNAINKVMRKEKKKSTSEEEPKSTAKKRKKETPEGDDTIEKDVGIKEEPIDYFYNSSNELEEMRSEDPDPLRTDKIKSEDTLTHPTSSSTLLADPGTARRQATEDPATTFRTYTHKTTR